MQKVSAKKQVIKVLVADDHPVVRKGLPVGIVTEKDFVEKSVARNVKPGQVTVKEIMNSPW
jgi:predicted transcriptional regulator